MSGLVAFPADFHPIFLVELREKRIAIGGCVDPGQLDPIGDGERIGKDLAAAYHRDFIRLNHYTVKT